MRTETPSDESAKYVALEKSTEVNLITTSMYGEDPLRNILSEILEKRGYTVSGTTFPLAALMHRDSSDPEGLTTFLQEFAAVTHPEPSHNPTFAIIPGVVSLLCMDEYSFMLAEFLDVLKQGNVQIFVYDLDKGSMDFTINQYYRIEDADLNVGGNLYAFYEEKRKRIKSRISDFMQECQDNGIGVEAISYGSDAVKPILQLLPEIVVDNDYLRLYVPDEQYQSEQIESFIKMFESYLNRVEQWPIRVDSIRSGKGTFFVFKMPEGGNGGDTPVLKDAIAKFEAFMVLCHSDQQKASHQLSTLGLTSAQASTLITKYAKQYNRWMLDRQQEFQRRLLDFQHAMQSEIQELQMGGELANFEIYPARTLVSMLAPGAPVTVTVNGSERAQLVANTVNERIYGNPIVYSPEEQEVLRAIQETAETDEKALSLKADLDVLKDETADRSVQRNAYQRLQAFGKRHARAAFEIICKVAFEYYIGKLEGGP